MYCVAQHLLRQSPLISVGVLVSSYSITERSDLFQ